MRKQVNLLFITLFFLVGCSSNKTYTRDTSEGQIIEISLAEWETKMENKDTFMAVFSQLYCYGCNELHAMLDMYLTDHGIEIYEIILDYEEGSSFDNQDRINKYLDDFSETPGVYFIQEGLKKDSLSSHDAVQEESFDAFIQMHQLDQKKE